MTQRHTFSSVFGPFAPILFGLACVVVFLLVAVASYMRFWPQSTLTYSAIVAPNARAGQTIPITFSYCRYTNLPAAVTRELVGVAGTTTNVPLSSFTASAPTGCATKALELPIPKFAPPGTYIYQDSVQFKLNSLRTATVTAHSNPFVISAR